MKHFSSLILMIDWKVNSSILFKLKLSIFSNLDGLENFVRTEDLNELERTWPIKRKEIGEVIKNFVFSFIYINYFN